MLLEETKVPALLYQRIECPEGGVADKLTVPDPQRTILLGLTVGDGAPVVKPPAKYTTSVDPLQICFARMVIPAAAENRASILLGKPGTVVNVTAPSPLFFSQTKLSVPLQVYCAAGVTCSV